MQTWLRSGSNCRVRGRRLGKIFRMPPAPLEKANKSGVIALA
jgi:hypothetical protein